MLENTNYYLGTKGARSFLSCVILRGKASQQRDLSKVCQKPRNVSRAVYFKTLPV